MAEGLRRSGLSGSDFQSTPAALESANGRSSTVDSTLRWCTRLAGYGFVVAAPEIYHRIEAAGTVLEFDDEGKRRGQADADATPVVDFDDDIRAALDWLETDDRVGDGGLGATGPRGCRVSDAGRARRALCGWPG